jgi:hypothetical protein
VKRPRWVVPLLDYGERSREPLTILLFLLPAVLFYEGRLLLASSAGGAVLVNKAQHGIFEVLSELGLGQVGLALPGIALVLVLLIWHTLLRKPWRADPGTLVWMAAESAAMALPLLLFARLLAAPALAVAEGEFGELDLGARIAVSLGAGLYEELLFRLLLLAAVHTLLVDLLRLPNAAGTAVAVVVSAALFALYHPLGGGDDAWRRGAFFLLAGLWLGTLMVFRGFGITVGAHAIYDLVVLTAFDR